MTSSSPPGEQPDTDEVTTLADWDEARRGIDATLGLLDASRIDVAYAVLRIIESATQELRPRLLKYTAEIWERAATSGEIKPDPIITTNELDALETKYGNVVNGLFDVILAENPTVDDFYLHLYDLIHNPVLNTEQARAFALYWLMIDRRLPYFHLEPGVRVSDDDWVALGRKIEQSKDRARFILGSSDRIERRSEEADLLLQELDALSDRLERVRLLAFILYVLRDETRRLADALTPR